MVMGRNMAVVIEDKKASNVPPTALPMDHGSWSMTATR